MLTFHSLLGGKRPHHCTGAWGRGEKGAAQPGRHGGPPATLRCGRIRHPGAQPSGMQHLAARVVLHGPCVDNVWRATGLDAEVACNTWVGRAAERAGRLGPGGASGQVGVRIGRRECAEAECSAVLKLQASCIHERKRERQQQRAYTAGIAGLASLRAPVPPLLEAHKVLSGKQREHSGF